MAAGGHIAAATGAHAVAAQGRVEAAQLASAATHFSKKKRGREGRFRARNSPKPHASRHNKVKSTFMHHEHKRVKNQTRLESFKHNRSQADIVISDTTPVEKTGKTGMPMRHKNMYIRQMVREKEGSSP